MGEVSTIGLDIAKSVFQVHGVDIDGAVVVRKRVSRVRVLEFFAALPPCLVGIEACPTAHHWSRQLQVLGHTVRLMPPSYVKAYLKRSKNDANDAAAICEAVTRPSMRFVPTKSEQQQSGLMLHRSRQLLVRQRTMLSNAIRGHMAELGIISAKGRNGTAELLKVITNAEDDRIPAIARFSLDVLANSSSSRHQSDRCGATFFGSDVKNNTIQTQRRTASLYKNSPVRFHAIGSVDTLHLTTPGVEKKNDHVIANVPTPINEPSADRIGINAPAARRAAVVNSIVPSR
jgi:hypothetical protein